MNCKQLLTKLSSAIGVSGKECDAAAIAAEYLRMYTSAVETDALGNVIACICEKQKDKPTILLDAHMDEIGLIVTAIDGNGFVHVGNCGGVDRRLLLAQDVIVHAKQPIFGVIASKPPHLMTADDEKKVPQLDNVLIDVGFSAQEAKKVIALGDRITMCSSVHTLLHDRISGKAMDDRAGVAAILLALEKLKEKSPGCGLFVLFSAQEETGTRGAKTGGFSVYPDVSISVDVSFAHTSDAPEHKCGKMGEGVMIGIAPTLTDEISKQLVALAKEKEIPYQLEIMSGETSTNADVIGLAQGGVKTGLCSIPLRYMHTPVETIALSDVESVADLLAEFVWKVGETHVC